MTKGGFEIPSSTDLNKKVADLPNPYILAARPKTLPAAIAPVLVGTGVAIYQGQFSWLPALLCLICSLLIQIGTNYANDYQDYKKGSDREDRLGPIRVTSAGLLSYEVMRRTTAIIFLLAIIAGIYLMWIGGWPIILIGITSIISAYAYTGGPYPLGYNGLGDLFVFIFFGLAAVNGTFFVQALEWSPIALIASLAPGFFSVAILVTNNHRDRDQDVVSGKKTLAVKLGPKASEIQYIISMTIPYLVPFTLFFSFVKNPFVFLPLLTIPLYIKTIKQFKSAQGKEFNLVLASTGKLLFIYSILFFVGMILSNTDFL